MIAGQRQTVTESVNWRSIFAEAQRMPLPTPTYRVSCVGQKVHSNSRNNRHGKDRIVRTRIDERSAEVSHLPAGTENPYCDKRAPPRRYGGKGWRRRSGQRNRLVRKEKH